MNILGWVMFSTVLIMDIQPRGLQLTLLLVSYYLMTRGKKKEDVV